MKIFNFKIIDSLLLILFFIVSKSEAKYGGDCTSFNQNPGKCLPIRSCASAYELIWNITRFGGANFINDIELLQQSQCDFIDNTPLICCPKEHIQIDPSVYENLKNLQCGEISSSKVANGQRAGLFEFRWMALLKYEGKEPFACGGSLIDERHILTAAHCLHNYTNLPVAVRLGEYDLNNETDCMPYGKRVRCLPPVQDIGVEKIMLHEDYVYGSIHNDIALLRLERPVQFSKHIRTICLPISESLQSTQLENYLTAGWGQTEKETRSNVLLWTSIPNRPHEFCKTMLGVTLSNEHICAGGKRFQDTCKGDSGGPLFYPSVYVNGVARSIQYGIVSFGASSCGQLNVPAVYINVSQYIQWITDHIALGL